WNSFTSASANGMGLRCRLPGANRFSKLSSMSRNPQLEAIFEARYAWENSAETEKADRLKKYHRLLDEALAAQGFKGPSREELEDALLDTYREFRRSRLKEERARLSRLR